ncbi:MAG: hypothetical protein HKN49_08295 [Gammaproteobacteria bacterium]|nr:hypothetical protein [Gammaproteobacteria bacterium]
MKTLLRPLIFASLGLLSLNASATTYVGTFLTDAAWTLIHGSATPNATTTAAEHLRWDANQQVIFDLTGSTLTISDPQLYTLSSNSGDSAELVLLAGSFDLDGPDGFQSGTLDYELNVLSGPLTGAYTGTFSFAAMNAANFPFNSSTTSNGVFEMYLWGGDSVNDLGIDLGISAPVPLPAPVFLLAAALAGLGFTRRR